MDERLDRASEVKVPGVQGGGNYIVPVMGGVNSNIGKGLNAALRSASTEACERLGRSWPCTLNTQLIVYIPYGVDRLHHLLLLRPVTSIMR